MFNLKIKYLNIYSFVLLTEMYSYWKCYNIYLFKYLSLFRWRKYQLIFSFVSATNSLSNSFCTSNKYIQSIWILIEITAGIEFSINCKKFLLVRFVISIETRCQYLWFSLTCNDLEITIDIEREAFWTIIRNSCLMRWTVIKLDI